MPGHLDLGFNSEQVQKIAEMAVHQVVGNGDNGEIVEYQKEMVNQWC